VSTAGYKRASHLIRGQTSGLTFRRIDSRPVGVSAPSFKTRPTVASDWRPDLPTITWNQRPSSRAIHAHDYVECAVKSYLLRAGFDRAREAGGCQKLPLASRLRPRPTDRGGSEKLPLASWLRPRPTGRGLSKTTSCELASTPTNRQGAVKSYLLRAGFDPDHQAGGCQKLPLASRLRPRPSGRGLSKATSCEPASTPTTRQGAAKSYLLRAGFDPGNRLEGVSTKIFDLMV